MVLHSSTLSGEEEEWGSEGEADRASSEGVKQASTPSEGSETPPPPAKPATPKLRVNASLATDPATRVPPPPLPKTEDSTSPAELEYLATLPSALQSGSGPVYVCAPCAIKFSSLSTLEAHQTYYCSHRHATQAKGTDIEVVSNSGGGESEPEDVKPVLDEVSGGEGSTGEPALKSVKSGKQYRCPHCSYSADKKVSLNRHMRMHSSSPASQTGSMSADTQAEGSGPPLDRYCQDCDIRFSTIKTFKAHKMHYCSTRHVIKSKQISAPSSPSDSRTTPTSPGASDTSNHPPRDPPAQPFLALPTNPILIVPYSLFQAASILSGPAVMGLPAQDTACLLLPDGTLQPLAQGLLTHSRMPTQVPVEVSKRQRLTSETVVKNTEETPNKNGVSEMPGAPLDLSVRTREEEGDLVIDMEEEDEKENRRSVDNQANIFPLPDPEDIICAPSIPLMLSTSSTCSSPSPAPPSPALSSSSYSTSNKKPQETKRPRSDSHSSSPSPKSSPSGVKSPRRTPNGLSNLSDKKHSEPKRKSSTDSASPPKMENTNNNLTLSSLLLAAAAQGQLDGYPGKPDAPLPFPPELVSHLTGTRLPGGKGKQIPAIPGLIPAAGRSLPIILPKPPRTPADLMNPATILPLLTSEMALRIAAAAGETPVPAPQVLVKQGVSKCQECNIVFCKHENYIAHKKHYCSARQLNEPVIVQDDDVKPDSPALSVSPPNTASPPAVVKDRSHSPANPAAITNSGASASKQPTLLQFICAACGIKFTSYGTLTAHQAYYCPKRSAVENEKGSRRCPKCKLTVPMDHVCGSSGGAWKCPCCPVISPTASAAQKHMDTHTGVKAFLCTICRYKGNTLRGMRTHIRMHFEKRSAEIMEENYITCLLEDGSGGNIEIPAVDSEENHIRKTPEMNNARSVNGEPVKVKEEVERRPEEEDDEYIEVDEVSVVKTEPQANTQDCTGTKSTVMRRVVSNVSRSLQVHR